MGVGRWGARVLGNGAMEKPVEGKGSDFDGGIWGVAGGRAGGRVMVRGVGGNPKCGNVVVAY